MIPADDPDIIAHRAKYAFYYSRANPVEAAAMDALRFINECLTKMVAQPRANLPRPMFDAVEKLTNVLEAQFMDITGNIRGGPAWQSLTDEQRTQIEESCLTIHFRETWG